MQASDERQKSVRAPMLAVVVAGLHVIAVGAFLFIQGCGTPKQDVVESPPPPVGFTFDFTFGPAGEQIARGVVEDRGTGSAAITQCVTDLLPPLRIPPPGQFVMVEVPLKFP